MKKNLLAITLLVLVAAACKRQYPTTTPQTLPHAQTGIGSSSPTQIASTSPVFDKYDHDLKVGGRDLAVQIVTTPADMQEGLSDRPSMGTDQGMLFDFGRDLLPGFWMPRMHFNLDLIWINSGKIIGITPDAPAPKSPEQKLPLYYPPAPVDRVLEVNAGWAAANKIKTGDAVRLK